MGIDLAPAVCSRSVEWLRCEYGNFNMGAGFAVYVPQSDVAKLQATATKLGFKTWAAGRVEQGPKQVIIKPENINGAGGELAVRTRLRLLPANSP